LMSRIFVRAHPGVVLVPLLSVYLVSALGNVYKSRADFYSAWSSLEATGREVQLVTPRAGLLYSDYEAEYFVTRRMPHSGMENRFARELHISPELAHLVRVATEKEIDGWLMSGLFDTLVMWNGDSRIEELGLLDNYDQVARVDKRLVFCRKAPEKP